MNMNINDLLNLNGGNVLEKVVDSIDEVRDEIGDLTTDLTCKIYSDYLKRSLTNKHIINRVINTNDLGLSYEHLFNIVVDGIDNYYLIDLTYKQFKNSEFVDLLFQGYMKVIVASFKKRCIMTREERLELAEILFPNIKNSRDYYEEMYPERELAEGAMVTRYGPSPTGSVHLGNLYSAFCDMIYARQSNGVFYLRIEDTDSKREVEGGVDNIVSVLKGFNITPNEGYTFGGDYGSYKQSERVEIYQTYVKDLVIQGYAYPCFMTEDELAAIREEQEINKVRTGVYGIYAADRDLSLDEIKEKLYNKEEYVQCGVRICYQQ